MQGAAPLVQVEGWRSRGAFTPCEVRPGALPLDPAAFEKAGETFLAAKTAPRAGGVLILPYFAAFAARIASVSMGVTLNRSPQMP